MIKTAFCDSAKLEFLNGVHQPGDVYKLALYGPEADLDCRTSGYTSVGEVRGAGYSAGGVTLAGRKARLVDGSACMTFANVRLEGCTFEAAGALIYNASRGGAAVSVVGFDAVYRPHNGTFELDCPGCVPGAALVEIS